MACRLTCLFLACLNALDLFFHVLSLVAITTSLSSPMSFISLSGCSDPCVIMLWSSSLHVPILLIEFLGCSLRAIHRLRSPSWCHGVLVKSLTLCFLFCFSTSECSSWSISRNPSCLSVSESKAFCHGFWSLSFHHGGGVGTLSIGHRTCTAHNLPEVSFIKGLYSHLHERKSEPIGAIQVSRDSGDSTRYLWESQTLCLVKGSFAVSIAENGHPVWADLGIHRTWQSSRFESI